MAGVDENPVDWLQHCSGHIEVWKLTKRERKSARVHAEKGPGWPKNCFLVKPDTQYRLSIYVCDKPEQKLKVNIKFGEDTSKSCGHHPGKCAPAVQTRSASRRPDNAPKPGWKCMTLHKFVTEEATVVEVDLNLNQHCVGCTSPALVKVDINGSCANTNIDITGYFKLAV